MRAWLDPLFRSRWLLVALLAGPAFGPHVSGQQAPTAARVRPATPPEITAATATGPAAEVLALEQKIEAATVKGDTAFAETILSSDFHFRHGDGWTRGEKTGGMEDDRAAFMKRIADKEYLVHDLDGTRIEMHGDLAITWGRYVSLFMPKNRNNAAPGRLTTIPHERVWANAMGVAMARMNRVARTPPAGADPQVSAAQAASYVPGCRRRARR